MARLGSRLLSRLLRSKRSRRDLLAKRLRDLDSPEPLLWRKLEARRVLSVNFGFDDGVLQLDFVNDGDSGIVQLHVDDGDSSRFHIQSFNGTAISDTGSDPLLLADLEQVLVRTSDAGFGRFDWGDDFAAATNLASASIGTAAAPMSIAHFAPGVSISPSADVSIFADLTLFNGSIDVGDAMTITGDDVNFSDVNITAESTVTVNAPNMVVGADASILAKDGFHQLGTGSSGLYGSITTEGGDISFASAVDLAGSVDLTSGGGDISFASTVNGQASLTLDAGSGDITFADDAGAATRITQIRIDSADDLTFNGALNVGSITQQAGTGTTTFGGDTDLLGTLSLNTDSIRFETGVEVVTLASVELTAQNSIEFAADAVLSGDSSITILMQVNQDGLGSEGFIQAAASQISTGSASADAIEIVVAGSGGVALGSLQTGSTGRITIEAGGSITNSGAASNLATGSAALTAAGGIGSTGNALRTQVSQLGFSNSTSGDVVISNQGALTIAGVGALATSSNFGHTTLTATSPITFAVDTTQASILAQATESAAHTDNITVNGGVTVTATSGDVVFEAGDRILLSINGEITATAGDIFLDSGFGDIDGDGSMSFGGAIRATAGTVTLDLNNQQDAWQAAVGTIEAANLLLLSGSPDGSFHLANSTANEVDTLAANTSGAISYRDADGLTVGTVNATSGINTTDDNVAIQTGGTLAIDQAIAVDTANLTLNSAGAVSQTAAIRGGGLELFGAGPFTLTHANNAFATLAANTTGAISYRDADGLTVGTVNATSGINTTDDDVAIQTGGMLAIDQAIAVDTANLTLNSAGAVTQTAAISGGGLELLGAGPFTLTNAANAFTTLAANTTGAISYRDADGLTVGTVNATSGINTTDDDVAIQTGGALAIDQAIAVGTADLTLNSAGAVTQAAAISGGGLELLGAGPFTLTNAANAFTTLAANTTGAISYRDADGLTVGTVNATSGINTTDDDVAIQTGGMLAIDQVIAVDSADLTLNSAGAVTQAAAISGGGLELLGAGPFTLTNSANAFTTLAANTTGTISYRDADGLTVGTVNATSGINSSDDDVAIQTGGALAIDQVIAVDSADLTLRSGGAVSQTAAISGGGLELIGSGPFVLTHANNAFATLAANVTGTISYRDTDGLTVGTVNTTSGINTTDDSVSIQTGGMLAIDQAIAVDSADLTLNSAGAVTQTAAISGGGLELLGAGPFTLTNAANAFTTLAANTSGAISYRDADGLTVGTVNATSGINTTDDDVAIQTGGMLAIDQVIAVDSADLTLNSAGVVTQAAAISGGGLELLGAGPFAMTNAANAFTTLAANTSGAISYRDADGLTVGTVNATNGINTTDDDVAIQTGGALAIDQVIAVDSADLTLNSTGAVTQAAAISGGGLELLGAGPFTLTNAANAFTTLAANTTGVISYRDADGLTVGTVNATSGINTTDDDVAIQTGGALAIDQAIAVDSADLTLNSTGAVTQAAAISGGGLELLGAGPFTLTNAANAFTTLAANTSGAISYRDADGLTVGTVNATSGINTTDDDVSIQTGGALAIDQVIAVDSADLTLNSAGAVTQAAAISGGGLELLGAGPFTLTNAGNAFTTLAANTSGAISYRDADGLTVGTVNATNGINTTDDDVAIQTGGALAIDQAIAVDTANLTLNSAGAVTQAAAISGGGLELLGAGPFTLNHVGNSFTTIAANTAGAVIYRDSNALAVGAVEATTGIDIDGNLLLLTDSGDLSVDASVAAEGHISLIAFDGISQSVDGDLAAGGSIDLLARNGGISMVDGATSTTQGDDIRYSAATLGENVTLGLLEAAAGDVSVIAGGDILDARMDIVGVGLEGFATAAGAARTENIIAAGARLVAEGSIGAGGNPLDLDVDVLAASAGGNVYIYASDALEIGTVTPVGVTRVNADSTTTAVADNPLSGVNATAGHAKIETIAGSLTIREAVAAGQEVLLAAGGAGSGLTLDAAVTSDGGSISILAQVDVTQNDDLLVAGGNGSISARAVDGSITMADGVTSTTQGGNIRYAATTAGEDVTLSLLDAGTGDVSVIAGGDIVDARADSVGANGEGFATQTDDPRTVNISADGARLVAGGDIGAAGNPLDLSVATLAGLAGSDVYLYESDTLQIGSVGPVTVNRVHLDSTTVGTVDAALSGVTATAGHAKVETIAGTLTVNQAVDAGEDVLLAAGGAGSDVTLSASVTSDGGISVLAQDEVLQNATGDLLVATGADSIHVRAIDGSIVMADEATTTTQGGNIRYSAATAGEDVTLGLLNAGAGDVSVIAGRDILDARGDTITIVGGLATETGMGRTVNLIAAGARLDAGNDIGTTANRLDITVNALAVDAAGDANLYESDELHIDKVGPVVVTRVHLDSTESPVSDAPFDAMKGGVNVGGDLNLVIGGEFLSQSEVGRVLVVGNSRFDFIAGPDPERSLLLLRASTDPYAGVPQLNDGLLVDNDLAGTITVSGINHDLRLRNISETGGLPLDDSTDQLPSTLRNLELWYTQQSITLGDQTLTITQDLSLYAGVDGDNPKSLTGVSEAGQTITDTGTDIIVLGDATFAASGMITLTEAAGETLDVAGLTTIISLGGSNLTIVGEIGGGTATLNELAFYTQSRAAVPTYGDIDVKADQVEIAVREVEIAGDSNLLLNEARDLTVTTSGAITDSSDAQIQLDRNAKLTSDGAITLADGEENDLRVRGDLSLKGTDITIGRSDFQAEVVIGNVQSNKLTGVVSVTATDFTLYESDDTVLGRVILVDDLIVSSEGMIRNAIASDWNPDNDTDHVWRIAADRAELTAETGILINGSKVEVVSGDRTLQLNELQAHVEANINYKDFFTGELITNQDAGETLETIFSRIDGLVNEADFNEGITAQRDFETIQKSFSIDESLGTNYALFIRNQGDLTVDGVDAVGAGLNLYIETVGDNAGLVIADDIRFHIPGDGLAPGGIVLIAGGDANELQFINGARIESSRYLILNGDLDFEAYDAGDGPSNDIRTTRIVVPEFAAQNPAELVHWYLQVAAEFGFAGETGFQPVVAYADGRFQDFAPLNGAPLPAEPTGDLFIRGDVFDTIFLLKNLELPTAMVVSRGEDVYMFSDGGDVSLSAQSASILSAESSDVTGIISGQAAAVILPEPVREFSTPPIYIAPDLPQTIIPIFFDIEEFDEPRPIFESVTQIDLMLLEFEDIDEDGQMSAEEFRRLQERIAQQDGQVNEELIEEEGLLKEAEEDGVELPNDPTPEQIERLKEYVRELGNIDIFVDGPYGILYQDRFSGSQWMAKEIFAKPEDLPEFSSPSDRVEGAAENQAVEPQPAEGEVPPPADAASPDQTINEVGANAVDNSVRHGAMLGALWMLQQSRKPQTPLRMDSADSTPPRFSRAARRSRGRERAAISR